MYQSKNMPYGEALDLLNRRFGLSSSEAEALLPKPRMRRIYGSIFFETRKSDFDKTQEYLRIMQI